MKQFFHSFFYEIDFFKYRFYFTFDNGKEHISTQPGKIFSVAISIILLVMFWESDLISKSNSSTLIQALNPENNPPITLNSENFNFHFGLFDQNMVFFPIDHSILSVKITSMFSYRDNTLQQRIKHETFKTYSFCQNYIGYCLDDENFILNGYINEKNSTQMSMSITLCNNLTSNNTCKSRQEINKFVLGKILMVWYQDYSIDYDNYDHPLKFAYNTDYMLLDPNLIKTMSIYLKKAEFFDDKGFFFADGSKSQIFMKDYSNTDFISSGGQDIIGSLLISSGKGMQKITRSYQKMGQLFSNLLLIYNILLFTGEKFLKKRKKINILEHITSSDVKNISPRGKKNSKKMNFNSNKIDISRGVPNNIQRNSNQTNEQKSTEIKELKSKSVLEIKSDIISNKAEPANKNSLKCCCWPFNPYYMRLLLKERKIKEKDYNELTNIKMLYKKLFANSYE